MFDAVHAGNPVNVTGWMVLPRRWDGFWVRVSTSAEPTSYRSGSARSGVAGLDSGLEAPVACAQRPERRRAGLLSGAAEHIAVQADFKVFKPGSLHKGPKLCFQQSAGDSASPQVYVFLRRIWNGFLDNDIADLHPAAGLKDTVDLTKNGQLVRA